MLHVLPLTDLPEIRKGDDLPQLLADKVAALGAATGDVLVVTSKIV